MAMLNLTLPNFNESDLSDEKQRRRIMNYLVKLDEQLRFVLNNLDEENVTETFRTEIIRTASKNAAQETVTVKAIQNELGRLSTEIRQAYDAIELKLGIDDYAAGVNTQNGILIDMTGVHIEGGVIEMNAADGEEYIHITSEGIAASGMSAPNVTPRYAGPGVIYVDPEATEEQIEAGNYVRSLQDALDRVNGRYVPYNVAVQMKAGMTAYEEIAIRGAYFAAGFAVVGDSAGHAKIVGGLQVQHCVGYVKVQYVDVNAGLYAVGMQFTGNGVFAHVTDCVITGTGVTANAGSRGIVMQDGAKGLVSGCGLYDSEYAMIARTLSQAQMTGNKGNCRYGVDAALVYASGTAPCNGSEFVWTYWNAGELRNAVTAVDQGSRPGAEALPGATTYALSESGSYAMSGGWGEFDDTDIRQGYTPNAGRIIGCMWFESMSGLIGKEILQANLKMKRMSGYGRSSAVTAVLYGITGQKGGEVLPARSYGAIGAMESGQETTVTIPKAAAQALAAGTITGLALFTAETEVYKDRSYSKNYARFAGAGSGEEPEITVIYR